MSYYRKRPSKKEIIADIFLEGQRGAIKHLKKNRLEHLIPLLFEMDIDMPFFGETPNPFDIKENISDYEAHKIKFDQLVAMTKSKNPINYLKKIGINV